MKDTLFVGFVLDKKGSLKEIGFDEINSYREKKRTLMASF